MIKHICFDLDGTLINSYNTIYKSTIKTLKHLNIDGELNEKEFYDRIGHHFLNIFAELKIPVTDIEQFINIYKGYYFEFIDDSDFYPGVVSTLKQIHERGIKISLLTTKGQEQADLIIDHFGLREYFSYVMGRRLDIKIKPAPEPLLQICAELGAEPSETIMVGDSELDINCGKNAGTKTAAVTYGYRSVELLTAETPDILLNSLSELINHLE